MNKLIKLSELHYIIVDDSEIRFGDLFYSENERGIVKALISLLQGVDTGNFKITHSTQPLEPSIRSDRHDVKDFVFIKPLSLYEIEEVINGYSVEKMAEKSVNIAMTLNPALSKTLFMTIYKEGFKAHQELVKDKLFTIESMKKAINLAYVSGGSGDTYQECEKFIEEQLELQPKTEWNIEFDKQGKIKLI